MHTTSHIVFSEQGNTTSKLCQSLKLWQVVMIGLAYITPMTVFDTFGMVSAISHGHVPVSYIFALIAVLITAFSYIKLIKAFPSLGSAYTYSQKAINPHIGFLVGWASLLCYILLPMHCAMLTKFYMSSLFPAVPQWCWVIMFTLIISIINLRSINLAANFSTLFVLIQIAIIIVSVVLAIQGIQSGEGVGTLLSLQPVIFESSLLIPVISGATILCFSFIGFDAVTTLSEETPNPAKTISRAIFLVVIYGGLIFTGVSFILQLFFPDVSRFPNPQVALPDIAFHLGGALFFSCFIFCTLINTLAGGLASQASVARLLYVMGRDNVIPRRFFGYIHPKWHTPAFNIILIGLLIMAAIAFDEHTADIAYALVNFGALVAFTFVNLSVISHFFFKLKRYRSVKDWLQFFLLPLFGALTVGVLWLNLEQNSWILGFTWTLFGVGYLMYITRNFRRPPPQFKSEPSL